MGWIVYDKTGEIKRCTIKELEYNGSFMGERTISCSFESPIVINFAIGDYLTYRGEGFYLYYTPSQQRALLLEVLKMPLSMIWYSIR